VFYEVVNSGKDDVASPVIVLVYSHKDIGRILVDTLAQNLWKFEARDYAIAPWGTENIFKIF
jgi:hypothetical protein